MYAAPWIALQNYGIFPKTTIADFTFLVGYIFVTLEKGEKGEKVF